METPLRFTITTTDGKQETQELTAPPGQSQQTAMRAMMQYSQVGMLKKEGSRLILLPSHRIALVEVELPLVSLATTGDASAAAQAAGSLKRILPG